VYCPRSCLLRSHCPCIRFLYATQLVAMFKLEKLPTSKRLHRPRFVLSTSSTPSHAPDMPPLRPEFLNGIITAATPQGSSDLPFYECPPDMIQPHSYRAARPDLPTLKEMILCKFPSLRNISAYLISSPSGYIANESTKRTPTPSSHIPTPRPPISTWSLPRALPPADSTVSPTAPH